ncbi:MAG: hypothetical protein KJ941_02280 [Bacteroidetes bacterium]|nr:hypothetical protein [Bacteroidota bacterium]
MSLYLRNKSLSQTAFQKIILALVIVVSLMVILGWYLQIPRLVQLQAHWAPMQFNTALSFLLLSTGIFISLSKDKKYLITIVPLSVLITLTIIEYVLHTNLQIDNLFVRPFLTTETTYPGRMAPNTAFCFVLSILSIIGINTSSKSLVYISGFVGLLIFGVGATAITGYSLQIEEVYNWGEVTAMAAHTAFCFIFIGLALTLHARNKLTDEFDKFSKNTYLFFFTLSLQLIFFMIDMVVPLGVTVGIVYVLGLVLIGFSESRIHLNLILLVSILLIWVGYYLSPVGSEHWIVLTNRVLTNIICLIVYFLIRSIQIKSDSLRIQNETLDKLVLERTIEIQERNKELEQFAYISTHDLQEPIRTISSYSQLLSETNRENVDELGKRSIDYIIKSSLRAQNLIKGLLDYARLGAIVELTEISMRSIITEITEDLGGLLKESNAQIKYDELPNIYGFEKEIKLLFLNLIANGIKYRKKEVDPIVEISYHFEMENHLFVISDNGIGIEAMYKDRIFHLFQRLHDQNEYEGTGIGLAQCKKIVGLHNGEIWVESIKNEGSKFYIRIPKKIKMKSYD